MKNLLIILLGLLIFLSCQKKRDEAMITKFVCSQLLYTLDKNMAEFKREVEKIGRKPYLNNLLRDFETMEGWRNNYLKNRNRTNLLLYADSIYSMYIPYNYNEIAKQLADNRKVVSQSKDTLAQLNLLFWTLKAEEDLQTVLSMKVGSVNPHFKVPLYINSINNNLSDTIYATFKISEIEADGWKYNFDNLFVINKNTQINIPRTVIKVGPYFVIQTVPKEKGDYLIKGKVEVLKFKDYSWSFPVEKSFKVN